MELNVFKTICKMDTNKNWYYKIRGNKTLTFFSHSASHLDDYLRFLLYSFSIIKDPLYWRFSFVWFFFLKYNSSAFSYLALSFIHIQEKKGEWKRCFFVFTKEIYIRGILHFFFATLNTFKWFYIFFIFFFCKDSWFLCF